MSIEDDVIEPGDDVADFLLVVFCADEFVISRICLLGRSIRGNFDDRCDGIDLNRNQMIARRSFTNDLHDLNLNVCDRSHRSIEMYHDHKNPFANARPLHSDQSTCFLKCLHYSNGLKIFFARCGAQMFEPVAK